VWRMLYETAARASEVLALNVEDLDLGARRAPIRSKGGDTEWICRGPGTAHLLPRLLRGRRAGPVFLSGRRPARRPPARSQGPRALPPDATLRQHTPAGCPGREGLPSSRRRPRCVPRPLRRGVPHGCAPRLFTGSMAFTLITGARHSLAPPARAEMVTTPQASRHATDRIVTPASQGS
jgi:hypothetical protein